MIRARLSAVCGGLFVLLTLLASSPAAAAKPRRVISPVPKPAQKIDFPDVLRRYVRSEGALEAPKSDNEMTTINGFPVYQTTTGIFLLMKLETLDEGEKSSQLPEEPEILDFAKPYEQYINLEPELRFTADLQSLSIPLPVPSVDHSSQQTPVRNQADRPTCVAHAALAAMEASVGDLTLNLSEEYANHVFMRRLGSHCCMQPHPTKPNETIEPNTVAAAGYLAHTKIPVEGKDPWSYHTAWPMCDVKTDCYAPQHDDLPVNTPTYELDAFDLISKKKGLRGPSIRNSAYLEVILASGYDIVLAMDLAWPEGAQGAVIPVFLDKSGMPMTPTGGHAMLLVGYDRAGKYFIAKNSMGPTWGYKRSGYARLSYGYIATYARYGFIVRSVTVKQ